MLNWNAGCWSYVGPLQVHEMTTTQREPSRPLRAGKQADGVVGAVAGDLGIRGHVVAEAKLGEGVDTILCRLRR